MQVQTPTTLHLLVTSVERLDKGCILLILVLRVMVSPLYTLFTLAVPLSGVIRL